MDILSSQIESLLFTAGKALSLKELGKITELKQSQILEVIANLKHQYQSGGRGVRITTNGYKVELVSAPEHSNIVKRFSQSEKFRITQAQIETLTIIGYRGPLSKIELEEIRGVNCNLILRNLIIAELIDEITDKNKTYYQVSTKFLKSLGVSDVSDLPNYHKLSANAHKNNN